MLWLECTCPLYTCTAKKKKGNDAAVSSLKLDIFCNSYNVDKVNTN